MSRINTNISSLEAIHTLNRNNADLSLRLQRLSTGLQINSGKDAPAGLIASENLRSEMTGINSAINNSQRAGNVLNTAEGALNEVSALLLEVQGLTNQAANTGALSPEEIDANQLQVDAILQSVDRISNTTQFNGVKLLDGSMDYTTSNVVGADVANLQVNQAKVPANGSINVVVGVNQAATQGEILLSGGLSANNHATLEVQGNQGVQQITLTSGATVANVAAAVNQYSGSTGVVATVSGAYVRFDSSAYGSKQYVGVKVISDSTGNLAAQLNQTRGNGQDAIVTINGAAAQVDGLSASVRTPDLDLTVDLTNGAINTPGGSTSFQITGGGAQFQLGSSVDQQSQTNIGLQSIGTAHLGDGINGYLSTLMRGGTNSLTSGNTAQAQKIITSAISQVATLRGRIGAFQKDILDTNVNSLNVALENVTASESQIRDADFASETAAMTRAQILVQANTSILSQANSAPQNVLALLQHA